MKQIFDHWCIYYVWLVRFYGKKREQALAVQTAQNLVFVPLALYAMIYIVAPLAVALTSGDRNILRENRLILIVFITIFSTIIGGFISNLKYVKSKVKELEMIEDWEDSVYMRKGRRILIFHIFFSILSAPLLGLIYFLCLKVV